MIYRVSKQAYPELYVLNIRVCEIHQVLPRYSQKEFHTCPKKCTGISEKMFPKIFRVNWDLYYYVNNQVVIFWGVHMLDRGLIN